MARRYCLARKGQRQRPRREIEVIAGLPRGAPVFTLGTRDGPSTFDCLDALLSHGGRAHLVRGARSHRASWEVQFCRDRRRFSFPDGISLGARSFAWPMPADKFIRSIRLSRLVGRAYLPDGRTHLSAFAHGRVHRAVGFRSANVRPSRADRCSAPGATLRESLVGISRFDFDDCLWRLRSLVRGRPDVPRAGTPAQDASIAFDLLPSSATDQPVRRAHAPALAWFCPLYRRPRQRIFYRRTLAAGEDDLCFWRMAFLWRDSAGPAPSLVCSETCGRALRAGVQRGDLSLVGHQFRLAEPPDVMNLFCVGISHHTAKVETRERYAAQQSEHDLRAESGCTEALMLATCNRVEVYGSAVAPVATEQIARWLARGVAGT